MLLGSDGCITAYTLSVLRRVMGKGIRVVLVSGRAGASMRSFAEQVASPSPYIACNGGEIISPANHQVLDGLVFSVDMARACACFARENGFYIQAYWGDTFLFEGNEEYGLNYAHSTNMKGLRVDCLADHITKPTPKLLCVGEPAAIAMLLGKAKYRFGDTVSLAISKPYFMEFTPSGATKGGALQRLVKYIPLKPETTMAFGDSINDMTMLKWAGYGVVMENSHPEVRDAFQFVCPPNTQDGVAKFIVRHILKEDVIP
jgi:Cof subfamily protein (haloacid dehalogenase superfamily)